MTDDPRHHKLPLKRHRPATYILDIGPGGVILLPKEVLRHMGIPKGGIVTARNLNGRPREVVLKRKNGDAARGIKVDR